MTRTEYINYSSTLVGFAENEPPVFSGEDLFRASVNERALLASLPVNNYLKTPEQIETEFLCLVHHRQAVARNKAGFSSTILSDGYLDLHDMNETVTGFMEENY